MKFIYTPSCLLHDTGGHPEQIARLSAFKHLEVSEIPDGSNYLSLVHSEDYIEKVRIASTLASPLDNDTITSKGSFHAAIAAVGSSIKAAKSGGFALVRPPGHHAYPSRAAGFCLFNNIAIATRYLTGEDKRVFILDIDGHLGDGTSHIFYHDPQVLFSSLHQFPAYPGNGWVNELGAGNGLGYTVNIPLPPGAGDDIFWKGIDFILPIARKFNPDVVAVSAGFDAHQLDPLLQLRLSLDCYYKCGKRLAGEFASVFAILEGGYNLDILPKAIHNFVDGFNGKPQQHLEKETQSNPGVVQEFNKNLDQLHQLLKAQWSL